MMRDYDDCARLDMEAADDTAAWDARMRAALDPLPAWRGPRVCSGCDGRALGADALPCRECAGLGVRHG
jgi:hypothetical protein